MKGKYLTLIGTALTLAFTANVAVAESSKSPVTESNSLSMNAPAEIKLSPAGMKILCERSPLNSRCPGGTALITPTSGTIPVPLLDGNTTPDTINTPETLMPSEFEFESAPEPQ